jgi:hypothetical protein
MTYTARELISRAYNLSQIARRPYQTPTLQQINDGLFMLNELLAVKSIDKDDIPYFSEHILTPVVNQEKYFIAKLCEVQSATFNLGDIRISMDKKGRNEYFASSRVDSIVSYPLTYHWERTFGGSDFYVFFKPAGVYPIKIWGKFGFPSIASLDENLGVTYDLGYLVYLRFALAEAICMEYGYPVPDDLKIQLASYEEIFRNISTYDFSRKSIIPLGDKYIDNLTEGLINQRFGPYRP